MARVVILGASSGIGNAVARLRLQCGDQVHALARTESKLRAISDSGELATHAFDARDEEKLAETLQSVGSIDHLVLAMNAGSVTGRLEGLSVGAIRQAFENKFFPYVNAVITAANTVSGSITFVTGAAARAPIPGMGVLAATNAALNALVGVLALEIAPRRVNAVSPGVIDTPYWNGVPEANRAAFFNEIGMTTPVGRIGTADEVARSISFIMDHGFITGTVLDCDGGAHLK